MQRVDHSVAVCQVLTYKEGLFAALTHDLRINVTSFIIDLGGNDYRISARFDARSLKVDCAMADGVERPGLLSPRDRNDINNKISEVLQSATCPEIVLVSSSIRKEGSDYFVAGLLTLCGRPREISFVVKKRDTGRYDIDFSMHLPDFGIRPISILFGAIRIRPDILIHLEIPAEYVPGEVFA